MVYTQLGRNRIFLSLHTTIGRFIMHIPPAIYTMVAGITMKDATDAAAPPKASNTTITDLNACAAEGFVPMPLFADGPSSCSSEFTLVATVPPSSLLSRGAIISSANTPGCGWTEPTMSLIAPAVAPRRWTVCLFYYSYQTNCSPLRQVLHLPIDALVVVARDLS